VIGGLDIKYDVLADEGLDLDLRRVSDKNK
jgi:hypothetical protein